MKNESKEVWKGVVIDYLLVKGDKLEKIFAHAIKRKHRDNKREYYEIMVPSQNFCTYYIDVNKIEKFL